MVVPLVFAEEPCTAMIEPAWMIERAAKRGVRVRVLLEQHPYGTGSAVPALAYRSLQAHGVSVGWANPAFRYTHAK